jgi:hypothetical protein
MTPAVIGVLRKTLNMLQSHPLSETEGHRDVLMALGYLNYPKLFEMEEIQRALARYEEVSFIIK